jgi:orotate phosphoribosyltransferase
LAATTGLTVIPALRPVLWVARRAGPAGRHRGRPRFLGVSRLEPGAVLIDDVVTTGTTLGVAASVTGARHAVTATAGLRP